MASHSTLRASDADRDAVAERLRDAAVEGRLEPEELEDRLHAALRARTYGDLRRLLTDLPAKPMAWERRRIEAVPAALAVALRIAVGLAVVAVVLIVAALMAAWWVLWAVVWFALCARRSQRGRLGARCTSHRPPRARSVQRGRLAGSR